jgi:predicted transcriptional regulator
MYIYLVKKGVKIIFKDNTWVRLSLDDLDLILEDSTEDQKIANELWPKISTEYQLTRLRNSTITAGGSARQWAGDLTKAREGARIRKQRVNIEIALANKGKERLTGLNQRQVARLIGATDGGISLYFDKHDGAYAQYGIVRPVEIVNIEKALANKGKARLTGLNQTQVASLIGATPLGVSLYFGKHDGAYDQYGIVRPVEFVNIEKALANQGKEKLTGLNQKQVAGLIRASLSGVSHYLSRHDEAYEQYGIRRPVGNDVVHEIAGDKAMKSLAHHEGGIDLTPAKNVLKTQNAGEAIMFHLDPAQLQQLQNAPGFVPVIISIQPMNDLRGFLGIGETQTEIASSLSAYRNDTT